MTESWYQGNAAEVGADRRGWIVGHFIDDPPGVRTTKDVEIKWSTHKAGESRDSWVTGEFRTTFVVLVSGRFRVELDNESIVLEDQGDFLMWEAGVDHIWHAEEDSVLVTVRWPSVEEL